ncbi:hypothetical protein C8Q77DRAFT_185707 [Trametes polyzona]|nr:hypothetical protein C8Q77DRAFT_185707 [Trametes polyzona]
MGLADRLKRLLWAAPVAALRRRPTAAAALSRWWWVCRYVSQALRSLTMSGVRPGGESIHRFCFEHVGAQRPTQYVDVDEETKAGIVSVRTMTSHRSQAERCENIHNLWQKKLFHARGLAREGARRHWLMRSLGRF